MVPPPRSVGLLAHEYISYIIHIHINGNILSFLKTLTQVAIFISYLFCNLSVYYLMILGYLY